MTNTYNINTVKNCFNRNVILFYITQTNFDVLKNCFLYFHSFPKRLRIFMIFMFITRKNQKSLYLLHSSICNTYLSVLNALVCLTVHHQSTTNGANRNGGQDFRFISVISFKHCKSLNRFCSEYYLLILHWTTSLFQVDEFYWSFTECVCKWNRTHNTYYGLYRFK
jgi:hypothetical protein